MGGRRARAGRGREEWQYRGLRAATRVNGRGGRGRDAGKQEARSAASVNAGKRITEGLQEAAAQRERKWGEAGAKGTSAGEERMVIVGDEGFADLRRRSRVIQGYR